MKLTRKDWNNYVTKLSKINKTAGRKMQEWIDKHGTDDVEKLITVAYSLATKYGEAASATSCQMYDEVAKIEKVRVPPAEPKPTQSIQYVEKAIRSTLERAPSTVPSTVSELVKRTGEETTLRNAKRDGAYFAWIPSGDACPFCIMLASNGWRRASKKTINGDHAEHIHTNCKCAFMISFNGPGQIEGYDPHEYLDMYNNAEGDTWQDKINSMRRAEYAANKDFINAQKRAAYAKLIEKDNKFVIASHSNEYRDYLDSLRSDKTKLIRRQKRLLERVQEPYKWIEVKAKNLHTRDLAALTAVTGDEFAIFSKGNRKILLRGYGSKWDIPKELENTLKEGKWEWTSHSHPVISMPVSSPEDRITLRRLFTWQKKSVIINLKGETIEFSGSEQEWFNKILGVK